MASATNEPTTCNDEGLEHEIGDLVEQLDPVPQSVIDAARGAFSSGKRVGSNGRTVEDAPARSR